MEQDFVTISKKDLHSSRLRVVVLIVSLPLDNFRCATSRGEHVDDGTDSVLVNHQFRYADFKISSQFKRNMKFHIKVNLLHTSHDLAIEINGNFITCRFTQNFTLQMMYFTADSGKGQKCTSTHARTIREGEESRVIERQRVVWACVCVERGIESTACFRK